MHLHDLTIKKFHEGLLKKDFSALEITKEFFDYIEVKDKEIGAYLSLAKDEAFLRAEKADLKIAKDEPMDALSGVPLAIKDNILIDGQPATAASKILENYKAVYDATVIKKLKAVGAVFLGKTNMDEFAMGSSTENSGFKLTKNPYDLERVPGGSSGGSAAAVAAHMAVAAFGSDTGGSIRQPASFCGVVGLKPTYGAVSRHGLIAMASSLDQIGPFTKTVEDAAILFKTIAGKDQFDSTSVETNYNDELLNPKLEDVKKLTVGLPEEYFISGVEPGVIKAVESAINQFKSLGINFKKISLPHTKYALSCYYIIMPAEVSANLARFDGIRYSKIQNPKSKIQNLLELYKRQRSEGFGPEVKRRIILGTFVLSSGYYDAYYAKAQKARALIKKDFDEAFKEVDVILTPVAPTPAFKFGEKTSDPLAMYLSDIFTIPVNLAGLPAISIPVKQATSDMSRVTSHKPLPIGFQLIGKHWREADILGMGMFYERLQI
ncbi:MAG: aspartyl/glutamyl-tRNA amidotransferase subunit A [Candidatus Harrisonbacteria bacterium RIFCSPHIGHO2_01_FULL_44_13]|uniref:Glutamyl-tRNA(Gln) amidotransferase subunit A n=1 Tax=Candidatus Harrisonbacteria bacterium RIFCSPLOWO2_01_FULL_44_18 TaxID=1798407 RepID=A0A1G1ZM49_9BACT|nr:MAG: aspartyl/glutamyl-tRNA amidotransferase subunit A [Candidatus Harrisonbacteria bacterium RIFCSPHIGHO2_01_FULL_44_13]OGY65186.1 MAG: aspartyl/glutamyl-tRNA amidotransferase subunit A [Candidatus Harrisonbacteria bacterium RIFCSPLOWO2_01_FULL_44_18]